MLRYFLVSSSATDAKTCKNVSQFIGSFGSQFTKYLDAFKKNGHVEIPSLYKLDDQTLSAYGISDQSDRTKILKGIEVLQLQRSDWTRIEKN